MGTRQWQTSSRSVALDDDEEVMMMLLLLMMMVMVMMMMTMTMMQQLQWPILCVWRDNLMHAYMAVCV